MRLLILSLLLAGCATQGPVTRDGEWVLASLPNAPAEAPRPTLMIADERMSGFAGCNRLTAQIETDPNVAAFFRGAVGVTRMYCAGAPMEMERAFLDALNQTGDMRIEGDALIVFDAQNQEIMRFSRTAR